ncbi:acetaldehyde dehydrogenase (acetylating) [Desulfosporosinus youngiae]|uniref:Acetaldehyde dehydrogenase (Acetylating) n=1 Tax=Desulfosporosinus youngiae DSM 17734 TaxID=768710 RepID=H5XXY9_9FIRM|nr:acetaldehyde dehydrogenase (acetylating) [Desulfosporosinus youngiae]EHQ91492.1 acetaldehyde dehydrogenase (acetylating) [Desulfosporosinus youngiae DSM 17734]
MSLDYDLASIQAARDLVKKAKEAQQALARFSEKEIDTILVSIVKAVEENAESLARLAVEETNYGIVEHKITKNLFASREVYEATKDIKTVGIISEDPELKVIKAAVPVGVIAGITPTTNPTSTVIHNAICAIKGGNSIVFSPHPTAGKCSLAAAQLVNDAAVKAGAPDGVVGCISKSSMKATEELMHHNDVSVIIATGGSAMVKAAYSAGKPAFGVGPGNVPVFIERTADIKQAVSDIITSKSFDNGMICASEQAIIADMPVKDEIITELKRQGAYFLSPEEVQKVSSVVINPKGGMYPALVGQTPQTIARKAGFSVPAEIKVLIAPLDGYGPGYPLSYEKLTTVLGFYTVNDWHDACLLSIELLKLGGIGHSFAIHSQNDQLIREFLQKPVNRILVNTPSALGGIGSTTGLLPSLTLGCGTWGGSSISENLGPHHLINVKSLTYGIKKAACNSKAAVSSTPTPVKTNSSSCDLKSDDIADVVKQVLKQLKLC